MRKYVLPYMFLLVGIAMFTFTNTGCKKDKTIEPIEPVVEPCPDTISFAIVVEPIIQQSCSVTGCHNASAAGGYNLIGYANISTNASVILNVINHNSGFVPMPLGGAKLANNLIEQINCWNLQGALNN